MTLRQATIIALLLAAAPWVACAQSDAERARMEYERQQREYWRAQEAQRLEEARRQQQWDEQRKREQENEKNQFRMFGETPTSPSGGGAGSGAGAAGGTSTAEMLALRKKLLAQAALAPERNPLLGRWRVDGGGKSARKDELGQLLGMLANPGGAVCKMVFGDGIIEFLPKTWASIDGYGNDSLGPIAYRADGKRLWAIPDKGIELMGFDLVDRNRVVLVNLENCALVRVTAAVSTAQAGPSNRAAAPPNPAPPPASTRPPPEVCRGTMIDRLGAVRVDEVRQTLRARFKDTLTGTVPNSQNLRLDARGSACDDPRVQAMLYDFDAAGVLQSVTLVWTRPSGQTPAPIFSERAAALARFHALPPPQSPGRLQADTSLGRLVLHDMPEHNMLLESYGARR